MKLLIALPFIAFCIISCADHTVTDVISNSVSEKKVPSKSLDSLQTAYFASGCFWCVEAVYESVNGVIEAESGYAGGTTADPTYEDVCSGNTGHAETTKIYYDSTVISFEELVDVFFNSHDPSTYNQQGPDHGTQYRSIAYYQNEREKRIIEEKILTLLTEKVYSTITTEVKELDTFYRAEDYHQDYVRKNQSNSYVRNVSIPRVNDFKQKMPTVVKDSLKR